MNDDNKLSLKWIITIAAALITALGSAGYTTFADDSVREDVQRNRVSIEALKICAEVTKNELGHINMTLTEIKKTLDKLSK